MKLCIHICIYIYTYIYIYIYILAGRGLLLASPGSSASKTARSHGACSRLATTDRDRAHKLSRQSALGWCRASSHCDSAACKATAERDMF